MGKCQNRNRKQGVNIPGCPPQSFVIMGLFYEMIGKEIEYTCEELLKETEESDDEAGND
jgi:coenzyme F420-reducing hydrogenase gamma subunit